MSDFKKWWIDDVEESVCARVDHPKRGLHNMPWPDCDRVHVVMLVSDHEKQLDKLRKGNEILRKALGYYCDGNGDSDCDNETMPPDDNFPFEADQLGKRARQALKEYAEIMGDL